MNPRRNRVDPFGDLHQTPERGTFTGNRGCLVDNNGEVVRHHRGNLWIVCLLSYKDWRAPLDRPGRWTPLFFLDDAVALAAGHRPCGLCRRSDYLAYRDAIQRGLGMNEPPSAIDLNRTLSGERLNLGRGLMRGGDRRLWEISIDRLPDGVVIVDDMGTARLVRGAHTFGFSFGGWTDQTTRPSSGMVTVLTPQLSTLAMANGFRPVLHPTAGNIAPSS